MTAAGDRAKIGKAIGEFAEWLHFPVTLWVLHSADGTAAVAGFLVLSAGGRLVVKRRSRAVAILAPAALALLALQGPAVNLPVAALIGLLVGVGSGASGRAVALLAAVRWKPGPGAPVGAVAALLGARFVGPEILLASAAAAMVAATVVGEGEPEVVGVPASLTWGAAAAGFCVGLRVLEPSLVSSLAEGALFSLAWAAGLRVSVSRSHRADARAVVAAVFGCAAASAFLSLAEAWSAVFVMLGLAAAVGLVCGTGAAGTDAGRGLVSSAAIAGTLWSAAAGFPTATLGAAVTALVGGVAVWRSVSRTRLREKKPVARTPERRGERVAPAPAAGSRGPEREPAPVPAGLAAEPAARRDRHLEAAAELLEASRRAARIRSEALRTFRLSAHSEGHRIRSIEVIEQTVRAAEGARRRLSTIEW